MSSNEEKALLRRQARALRDGAERAEGAGRRLAENFLSAIEEMKIPPPGAIPGAIIAGYWPVGGEMDTRPLMSRLHGDGYICVLPVVKNTGAPLAFRRWRPGDVLEPGVHGIPVPGAKSPELTPQVVLTPLLAYDEDGYRLGQGGGYYDRTLQSLRAAAAILAVGIAYDGQQVPPLPREPHDEPLDWLVTDKRVLSFEAGRG
ncbi:MAG: 5-formyltetrahydrofolate cyclo-ligase [Rhodospirillales bacterium]